ncbi:MAG: TAT-variant-translocated molybdopterin oxidoreductase, partial [Flavobacteriales bacterium]|nr:TAT-variant-translocated molybdopterin oxidoreductase [Flavobacteriales bacterium]
TKRYWKDLGELHQVEEVTQGRDREFPERTAMDEVLGDPSFNGAVTGRRDFLKFLGFGLGAATLAACETPVIKSIPYVNKPEEITPGVANWYASTYYDGEDVASILVKTREGRPIHISGNPRFGLNRDPKHDAGTINARINSSVLTLYDNERLKGPRAKDQDGAVAWADADAAIAQELEAIAKRGGRIVFLSNTVISPSARAVIEGFKQRYSAAGEEGAAVSAVQHVQYDTISYSGITNAHLKCFGQRVMPSYDLTKADMLVGVDCDLLGGWGSSNEHSWQYASRRKPENGPMNRHWQFETRMSITGANADKRIAVKPSEVGAVLIGIHDRVAGKTGVPSIGGGSSEDRVLAAADALMDARGRSLLLCGSNDEAFQVITAHINWMLGNYGSTIDMAGHSWCHQGDDQAMARLLADMEAGKVDALIMAGVNPAYSLPNAEAFKNALSKVSLSVSTSGYADETASLCNWICPTDHFLESWNDLMPKVGHYALVQPTIARLFDTRQWEESLMRWSGAEGSYLEMIQSTWRAALAERAEVGTSFDPVWNTALHNGVYAPFAPQPVELSFGGDIPAAGTAAKSASSGAGAWEVVLYTSEALGNGLHANNPWLQELPDPLTKITWDNYVC